MSGIILKPRFPRKFYDRLRQIRKMHGENPPVHDPGPVPKVPINIRLDADVLHFFKAGGRGYQTRINAVLRAHIRGKSDVP